MNVVIVMSLCFCAHAPSFVNAGTVGFLVSTAVIVIFGEIVPQAMCSRYALYIGSRAVPVVWLLVTLLYVGAKPISMALDCALGLEVGTSYTQGELREVMERHVGTAISARQRDTVIGIMKMDNRIDSIMTPIDQVFTLASDAKLDFATIHRIFKLGFSRIPVCQADDPTKIVGVLYTKDLILLDPDDRMTVDKVIQFFHRGHVERVWVAQTLQAVLQVFQKSKTHLAIVQDVNQETEGDPFYEVKGIVTMEDIIESIIQADIEDEFDKHGENPNGIFLEAGPGGAGGVACNSLTFMFLCVYCSVFVTTDAQTHATTLTLTMPTFACSTPPPTSTTSPPPPCVLWPPTSWPTVTHSK